MTPLDIARRDLEDAEAHVDRLREQVAKGEVRHHSLAVAEWWAEHARKRVVRLSEGVTSDAS